MTKKFILEHFEKLGIGVVDITLMPPRKEFYRIVTDQLFLGKSLAHRIIDMPCFQSLCVTWGGSQPHIIIYINRHKPLE